MSDPARHGAAPKIRRRNRMITSCLECRRRKLKCDKSHPCINCKKTSRDCVFLAPALDSASQLKLTEVKEKMGMLEVSLEQEIARSARKGSASPGSDEGPGRTAKVSVDPDEDSLEPTPTAMADVLFDDDDPDNDFYDLGFTLGKLRLSDRIGGFFRPAMVQELGSLLRQLSHEDTPTLGTIFTRPANFIGPNEDFLPPSSDFFLSSGRTGMSLIHFLPARSTADRLLGQYWYAVHPLCRLTHKATFEQQYAAFWDDISVGVEPVASLQALIFAMLFSAAVSVDKETCMDLYGAARLDLIKNLQQATEMALGRAKFLRSTRLQTLQAFVMYITPMCRDQISRAHGALVASAIRLAENMSLHRDGARYGLKPIETHVRRLVWWQLCWLDHRCCEARGPRLIIREDDFDTKAPVNKDDENLTDASPSSPPEIVDRWTDMIPTLLKIDCLEVNRSIWFERPRIDRKQKSLTEVMIGIENNRRRIYAKYMPLLGERTPLQQLTKSFIELHLSKWHTAILHRFHHSVSAGMPNRLRQIMINTARTQIEAGVALSTAPTLKPWVWYAGAHQTWSIAFLLLVDYYAMPDWDQPERTWDCLDWIFEFPPTPSPLPLITKARLLMFEIWDRMRIYREDRKLRPPTDALKNISISAETQIASSQALQAAADRSRQSSRATSEAKSPGEQATSAVSPHSFHHTASTGSFNNFSPSRQTSESTNPTPDPLAYLGPNVDFASAPTTSPGSSGPEFEMPDIDWNEWDRLFPPASLDQPEMDTNSFNNFGYVVSPYNP